MKKFKRIFALLLAVVMMLGLAATAWAADDDGTTEDGTTTTSTGSITIENSVKGSTYTIYKIFSATYDGDGNVAYYTTSEIAELMESFSTSDSEEAVSCPFNFVAGTDGNYYVTVSDGIEDDDIITWLEAFMEENSGSFDYTKVTGTGGSLVINELAYGYYYITTATGSVVTIDSVTPDVTVIDKNQSTTNGTKTMTIDNKTVTTASVEYGTVIPFTITLAATNYVGTEKVTSYTIGDTLTDGLDLDTSSIEVYVNDEELTAGTDYALTIRDDEDGFTVVISWVDDNGNSIYSSNATITITYSATVTEEGDYNGEEETNTATFYYNETKMNEEKTDVTVYSFWLVKTDSSDNSVLEGAEFTLYYDEDCEEAVKLVAIYEEDGETISYYRVATDEDDEDNITTTIKAGYVEIKGLAEGTYYLEETTAPDGYIALTEAKTVSVGSNGTTVTFADDDGTTYESGGVNVANTAGSKLPSTGGMGRTILYAIGIILILGAGIVLVVRKRAKAN